MSSVGIVIIGRNEGRRLVAAIESVRANGPAGAPVAYVDSGSTDGSAEAARAAGCAVVQLDLGQPFTAARARNAGAEAIGPDVDHLFFMDGDCQLCPGFIAQALAVLAAHPKVSVVCGRRRELRAGRNVYHRLADMEWNTPVGEATACGGDAVIRRSAFSAVGGFDASVIAGEEPELCVRLRSAGGTVVRLDADMTLHDVAMDRFGQWWRRSVRAGFAFANGAWMHGGDTQRHWLRPAIRVWFWVLLPLLAAALAPITRGASLILIAAYALPLFNAARSRLRRKDSLADAALYSGACLIAKFAEFQGQLRFLSTLARGRPAKLIEYKQSTHPAS